jgi:endonuclease/exonuclease/phosphatase family metal-dependent hydrolase
VTLLTRLIVAFTLIAGSVLASAASAAPQAGTAGACNAVVDERDTPLSVDVTWVKRVGTRERERLDELCDTVGPIVLRKPPTAPTPSRPDEVAVVGWNIHVGGGDVVTLVKQLQSGFLTGRQVSHYVLMLEEAYRHGGGLHALRPDIRVPRRIAPKIATRTREDILSVARTLNAGLYYVPSMRNGTGPPFEDRGNAVLSTLPLEELQAIELPFTRQRRVAIGAIIRGVDGEAKPWALRAVTMHLDALAGASRLWIFASGWRARQAEAVLSALDHREPGVLGGDLNTWFLGSWERAYRRIEAVYPDTENTIVPAGRSRHGRLDYVFFRLPPGWKSRTWRPADPCGLGEDTCGSDHRPIVAILTFSGAQAGALDLVRAAAAAPAARVCPSADLKGRLYRYVLGGAIEPNGAALLIDDPALPRVIKPRLEQYRQRAKRVRSRLVSPGMPDPDGKDGFLPRQATERALVALFEAPGIAREAAAYARTAVDWYEYEGYPEGPLAEAAYAERYLARHPTTVLAPYLSLFLASRYRYAFETLMDKGSEAQQRSAARKYRLYLQRAKDVDDELICAAADDLDRQPFAYLDLPGRPHPRTFARR